MAYKIPRDRPQGLTPYSDDCDYVQVLSWEYAAGKQLQSHRHLRAPRTTTHTQEAIVVLSGRVQATIFDRNRSVAGQCEVGSKEALVLLSGGHGYEILEDNTRILEIKNGPYPGADVDRERLDP